MTIIQRYLLAELVLNVLFTFLVLSTVIIMLVFSVVALRSSTAFLTVSALLEMVTFLTVSELEVILPLTVLIACLWTYGRAQADGEVTAMRGAGIRLYHILVPGAVIGAVGTFALAGLQDRLIPESHYRQLVIGRRHLAQNFESLLSDERNGLQDKSFKVTWDSVGEDADGYAVIHDVLVAEMRKEGEPPVLTRARVAVPHVDPTRGELTLTLRDLVYGESLASAEMTITLSLRSLSEEPPPSRRSENLSYEALLTLARRLPDDPRGLKSRAEFHRRAATSFAAFVFALLGSLLGVVLKVANRAWVFTIGFLLVLVLHYAPILVGTSLARHGTLPAGVALWMGDALVAAATVVALRRALQR